MARPKSGYRLKNGSKVPGVTTITSRFGDKEALIGWSYNRGYEDGENGAPRNRFAKVETEADVGTYVHELVQWQAEGCERERPIPPEALKPENIARGEQGFEQFQRWVEQTRAKIISWEEPLVSEKYAFGGTPDGIMEFPDYADVGDWKTSKRFYPENLLQVGGGYILLIEENFPDWKIGGIQIVRFGKDAAMFTHQSINDKKLIDIAKRQFLRLREAYEDDRYIQGLF